MGSAALTTSITRSLGGEIATLQSSNVRSWRLLFLKLAGGWRCELLIDYVVDGIVIWLATLCLEGSEHVFFKPVALGTLARHAHFVHLLHPCQLLVLNAQPAESVGIALRKSAMDRIQRPEREN